MPGQQDDGSEHLVRDAAARRDWEGLWRLVRELPLAGAVAATRHFGDGWRPYGEREREFFERLAGTDPVRLARAREALIPLAVTQVTFSEQRHVAHGAISADGRLLALVRARVPWRGGTISVHELPAGTDADRVRIGVVRIDAPVIDSSPDKIFLAFAGDTLIAASLEGSGGTVVLRYTDDGRPEQLAGLRPELAGSGIFALAPCPVPAGGFALLRNNCVLLCGSDGTLAGRLPFPFYPIMPVAGSPLLDTEPGGRVAVAGARVTGPHGWAVYDAHTGNEIVSGACRPGHPTGICFWGPGRLITTTRDQQSCYVQLWQLDGARAGLTQTARFPLASAACNPVAVHGLGRVGVRAGYLRLFDPATLGEAGVLEGFPSPGDPLHAQWHSADKRTYGFAGEGFAGVFPARRTPLAVADRPPTRWAPEDLASVTKALADPAADPGARPLLELLRAGLAAAFAS